MRHYDANNDTQGEAFSLNKRPSEEAMNSSVELVARLREELTVHDQAYHPGMIGHGLVQVRVDDLRAAIEALTSGDSVLGMREALEDARPYVQRALEEDQRHAREGKPGATANVPFVEKKLAKIDAALLATPPVDTNGGFSDPRTDEALALLDADGGDMATKAATVIRLMRTEHRRLWESELKARAEVLRLEAVDTNEAPLLDEVERVAKAMAADQARRHYGIDRGSDEAWQALTDYGRDERMSEARAALEAIRNPSVEGTL